jgi:alpha-L-arabinofuranosidase
MNKPAKVSIYPDRKLFPVSPSLYGLFFEEISNAGDGGIYAELIRNRSFEDMVIPERCHVEDCNLHTPAGWIAPFDNSDPIPSWKLEMATEECKAEMTLDEEQPLNDTNPISLRVDVQQTSGQRVSVCNTGYWGIPVKKGAKYDLSFYAKKNEEFSGNLEIALEDKSGTIHAVHSVIITSAQWQKYELTLESDQDNPEAVLAMATRETGTFWLDLVSLFPQETFLQRKNGLRPDLVNMLQGLKPTFLRFPGGCFVEGFSVETAYRWKKTIGDLSERTSHWTLWHYRTTNGLGYHEYLQMAEDMGLDMMFVVNCGLTCQGRPGEFIPMDELDVWVQDMLDAIEYANGPVTSFWGAKRALNGHPEPYGLKYLEIGNENFGAEYNIRYKVFYDAVKAVYPEILTIWNTHWEVGTETAGLPVEIVDEHFYADNDFYQLYHDMYDHYDRNGPKIYVGEYAMIIDNKKGSLLGALSEAAFMTGMERNQDIVVMSSYAPLFSNIHHTVWDPNLIYFDAARVYGTPSYYVQKMFGENRGDSVVESHILTESRSAEIQGGLGLNINELQNAADVTVSINGEMMLQVNQLAVDSPFCRTFHNTLWFGDSSWKQYEVKMKVKLGSEGLKLRFLDRHQQWEKQNYFLWELEPNGESRLVRIVGWSRVKLTPNQKVSVKPNGWQDLRVVVEDATVRCYLDDLLVHEHRIAMIPYLTSVTTWDQTMNELIVKLVNPSEHILDTELDIHGAGDVELKGEQIILTSEHPTDINTMDQPTRVKSKASPFQLEKSIYSIPAYSVVILKIKL